MKIAYIDDFPYKGGAEVALFRVMTGIDRNRFEPHLVAPGPGPFTELAANASIPVHHVAFDQRKKDILRLRPTLKTIRDLKRQCCDWNIDLIHANSFWTAYFAAPVARKLDLPLILTVHAFPDIVTRWKRLFFRGTVEFLGKRLKTVITVSESLKADLAHISSLRDKLINIYQGVDPDWYKLSRTEARDRHNLPQDRNLVALIARMHPGKGQGLMVDSLTIVKKQFPDVQFVFVGQDCPTPLENLDYSKVLRNLSIILGVDKNVVIMKDVKEVNHLIPAFDVVCLPSEKETFGLACLEASAAGIPVIASNKGGLPEQVLDGQTGFLVPPQEPKLLAEKIIALLNSEQLRRQMGEAGRKQANEKFHLKDTILSFERIYESFGLTK